MELMCPICGIESDHRLVEIYGGFRLHHCCHCDVVFADPMKGLGPVGRPDTSAPSKTPTEGPSGLKPEARLFLHRKPNRGGLLLDVWPQCGGFLKRARRDYQVFSLEADGSILGHPRSPSRVWGRVDESDAPAQAEGASRIFDVVTCFDVLPLSEDPNGVMRGMARLMKPGATLVLSTPNGGRDRAERDPLDKPPRHLSRWTARAVEKLLRKNGFSMLSVQQWSAGWFGLYELEWIAGFRVPEVAAPLMRLLQKRRRVFCKNNPLRLYEETRASTAARRVLVKMSLTPWPILCLLHAARRRAATNLYIEARLET
jgi:SAM-dependent methyltransferase